MPNSSRRSASASACNATNFLSRWLTSITDMPVPFQSSNSRAACCITGSGSIAGPAPKLNTLATLTPKIGNRKVGLQLFAVGFDDLLKAGQLLTLVEVDEPHALGGTPHLANFADTGADQDAPRGDQHDLVFGSDELRRQKLAVALAAVDGDHALPTTAVARVFGHRGALAVAVLGRGQHRLLLVARYEERHHFPPVSELHATHAGRVAAHLAHLVLGEAHRLAFIRE